MINPISDDPLTKFDHALDACAIVTSLGVPWLGIWPWLATMAISELHYVVVRHGVKPSKPQKLYEDSNVV